MLNTFPNDNISVEEQTGNSNSLLELYKNLVFFRKGKSLFTINLWKPL